MNWSFVNKILNILLVIIIAGYAVWFFYKQPKYNSGEMAQNFETTLLDGSTFKLSDLRGRYLLLDFWGSWCGPCRQENPNLAKLYEDIKSMHLNSDGEFEIVSVAIETKRENWEKAIKSDGLNWRYHIGEFERFKSPIATLYGVKEIPTKYFISPEGKILLVNPSLDEVREYMLEMRE